MKTNSNHQTINVVLKAAFSSGVLKTNTICEAKKVGECLDRYGILSKLLTNSVDSNCSSHEIILRNYKSLLAFQLLTTIPRETDLAAENIFQFAVETGLIDDEDIRGLTEIENYNERLKLIGSVISSSTEKVNSLCIFEDYIQILYFKLYLKQLISTNNTCS